MSDRRPSQQQQQQRTSLRYPPDHGQSFIPGAGDETHAPKSLDHFKRGYQERADTRERECYGKFSKQREHQPPTREQLRSSFICGMDVNAVLDRLCACSGVTDACRVLEHAREQHKEGFDSGKAATALISGASRRRNVQLAHTVFSWLKQRQDLTVNIYHFNSMIAVAAVARKPQQAIALMKEMKELGIRKNEVTFSSAITACEKAGDWRTAIDLLESMDAEGLQRTAVSYNACISACEKGMVPQKACEIFQRMKREGIRPSVVTYSALISACEKGSQWRLALEILEDMKKDGFQNNVIAYSAAISALAKGQQWEKALELFREIQGTGRQPSIVTYNATMTALEKGLMWEKALALFDEMKRENLPITVVSYGSALSACDKGLQYRQCLEYLDEMTEMGIEKNVIIFGAAMSCMEKCCRADIAFQLMDRMKFEGVKPNVHIYNSVISACARSNLWEKGYELFKEMEREGVKRDVVTYNAVLDAVASQVQLGRMLFEEGVKQGFYARVSRLAKHWFELDLHFLSLGGGEIAMGWWFEECLMPYLINTEKLRDIKSISIVTGYGKTRTRGRRHGDDGMRKRCKAMLTFMGIRELEQANQGRIHIDMESIYEAVEKNGGRIVFDLDAYVAWKERETTQNVVPDDPQKVRPRYKPVNAGSGGPPFVRIETESTSPEYRHGAEGGSVEAAWLGGPFGEGVPASWSGDGDDRVERIASYDQEDPGRQYDDGYDNYRGGGAEGIDGRGSFVSRRGSNYHGGNGQGGGQDRPSIRSSFRDSDNGPEYQDRFDARRASHPYGPTGHNGSPQHHEQRHPVQGHRASAYEENPGDKRFAQSFQDEGGFRRDPSFRGSTRANNGPGDSGHHYQNRPDDIADGSNHVFSRRSSPYNGPRDFGGSVGGGGPAGRGAGGPMRPHPRQNSPYGPDRSWTERHDSQRSSFRSEAPYGPSSSSSDNNHNNNHTRRSFVVPQAGDNRPNNSRPSPPLDEDDRGALGERKRRGTSSDAPPPRQPPPSRGYALEPAKKARLD